MRLPDALRRRLEVAGVDLERIDDAAAAWHRLHELEGPRATLLDRYELEALVRGGDVRELDPELRARLAYEVISTRDPSFSFVEGSGRVRSDPVEVVEYDPAWPDRFDAWRSRLRSALGSTARRIEHVGSTSVPGLAAKPVLDIQVSVPDIDDEAAFVPAIEGLGVALRMRETGHRYFRPAGAAVRDVQIHVCPAGSAWERTHVLFRDYLRANPSAAANYETLKRGIATDFHDDRIAYNEAKAGWILDAIAAAEAWAAATGWRLADAPGSG